MIHRNSVEILENCILLEFFTTRVCSGLKSYDFFVYSSLHAIPKEKFNWFQPHENLHLCLLSSTTMWNFYIFPMVPNNLYYIFLNFQFMDSTCHDIRYICFPTPWALECCERKKPKGQHILCTSTSSTFPAIGLQRKLKWLIIILYNILLNSLYLLIILEFKTFCDKSNKKGKIWQMIKHR
jgi:hypothetical protein